MCNDCKNIIDETCENCTVKSSETELCDSCFKKKLHKQKVRKEFESLDKLRKF